MTVFSSAPVVRTRVPRARAAVFEVEPDEVESEFAEELHERRTVGVVEQAERDVPLVQRDGEVVRRR